MAECYLGDGGIAKEPVHPIDDQRCQMLHERRMSALDGKGKRAVGLLPRRKSYRFGRGDFCVALADNFYPTANDGALDEPEALECHTGNFADQVAGRTDMAAPRGIFDRFGTSGLRHRRRPCHSDFMPASAATQLLDERQAAERVLTHFDAHARILPWRDLAGDRKPDPYKVWLSEVMLQQTTVAAVKPRFRRFIERWPTVEALAAASDEDVMREWAGLGYYARARNLIACARKVAAIGGFPSTEAELRKLPGLGRYTAAAVAAIAFGRRAVVVDTNVARVLARYNGVGKALKDAQAEIWVLADSMTPAKRAGDFAQAMMDLGSTICRPRNPLCPECPLSVDCKARASGHPESFPAPKQKRERPHLHGIAWWIERGGSIWLHRRPSRGLLGGMAALPGMDWSPDAPAPPTLATVSHGFTHFTLDLHVIARASSPDEKGWWQPLDRIADAGLPTLYARAVEAVLARKDDIAA